NRAERICERCRSSCEAAGWSPEWTSVWPTIAAPNTQAALNKGRRNDRSAIRIQSSLAVGILPAEDVPPNHLLVMMSPQRCLSVRRPMNLGQRMFVLVGIALFGLALTTSAEEPKPTVRVAGIVLKWIRGDKEANYRRVEPLIREAAKKGAQIVCTT